MVLLHISRDTSIHEHRCLLISWLTINPKCLNILLQAGVYRAWHFTLSGVLPCSLYIPSTTGTPTGTQTISIVKGLDYTTPILLYTLAYVGDIKLLNFPIIYSKEFFMTLRMKRNYKTYIII